MDGSDPKTVLCRYFMNGVCREGANCRFSHNFADKPDNVCRFYLQGQCSYGAKCRYDHVRPKKQTERTTAAQGKAVPPPADPTQRKSSMVTLKKIPAGFEKPLADRMPANWVDTPAFVPLSPVKTSAEPSGSLLSYSDMAQIGLVESEQFEEFLDVLDDNLSAELLCPFAQMSTCQFGDDCPYLHGDVCDICNCQALHPNDSEQRKAHMEECTKRLELDMEVAFACKRSEGIACGICLDVVLDRPNPADRYFGILSECNHPFCLSCIRKWRQSGSKRLVRACPLCRTPSFYVTPSAVWVEDPKDKEELIVTYKSVLSTKPCKYFDQGRGTCPFGNSCFYRHANPQGEVVDDKVTLRHASNAEGEVKVVRSANLWSFFEARDDIAE